MPPATVMATVTVTVIPPRPESGDLRAWVIHPCIHSDPRHRDPDLAMDEALALAGALPGMDVTGSTLVRIPRIRPGMYFGSGRIEEFTALFRDREVGLVFLDGSLSPVQQRNLERAWNVKILDRTALILEIFSDRARTREGVLQVEMAALTYQRTRLVRAWTHLERQRGGLGFVGGPGETQIEADRRAIDLRLGRLRRELGKVAATRSLHRAARNRANLPVVALAGYTNAGKSTLFNRLAGAGVPAEDMLFATLDPTMRRVRLSGGAEVIMSDTVGFVSSLPTELVAAFRATLEEVVTADLILHVRDASHPASDSQAEDVRCVLDSLGVGEQHPQIEVLNKIDLLEQGEAETLRVQAAGVGISALTGEGVESLRKAIVETLYGKRSEAELHLGFAEGQKRAWLHDRKVVLDERILEDGYRIQVSWTVGQRTRYAEL